MKKVLVLVAAMLLVAANAMAFSSVVASKHNMQNLPGTVFTGDNDEVCVFCHTPHGADVSNPNAPLWNRSLTHTPNTFYNSATLDQTNSRPGVVGAAVVASDAPLCLSCHDGQAVTEALVNPPNSGTVTWGTFTWASAGANLGTVMNNDHPIGMNYVAVQTADAAGFVATPAGINFYAGNKMWCSSCHDVHSDSNYPFLAASNAASALCLTCHIK